LNASYGESTYVGKAAANVPAGAADPTRSARFLSVNLSVSYALNEHWQSAATYGWFLNRSTFALADFNRST
jgi:hypothetical protein